MRANLDIAALPVGVLIGLGVVALVEIVLDIVALVDLYRRPLTRVALGNKWIWLAVIVLVNLIGAVLYLAVGRKPAPAGEESTTTRPARSAAEIADALYGSPDSDRTPRP